MTEIFIFDANKNIEQNNQINKIYEKTVIVVCLYYRETVPYYCNYLNNITEDIRVHIISSKDEVLDLCQQQINRQNVTYHIKPNRGRDVSALLIAAKEVVGEYEYFCFIHDKSSNADYLEEDVKFWIKNLWNNMLYSTTYVFQILQKFCDDEKLGLLVPPEPYGDYYSHWYGDTWFLNYQGTKKLGVCLDLNTKISCKQIPHALSTVFWCRKTALSKLLDYPWEYEDFQEEPLPMDGTLSHAIERILQFVAEDAGYKVSTVMTTDYASKLLIRAQTDMRFMFSKIKTEEHIFNMHQVRTIDEWKKRMISYAAEHDRMFIYGAGAYGQAVYDICKEQIIDVAGFIVSDGRKKQNCSDVIIKEIGEIDMRDGDGIIVGVSYEYRKEIHEALASRGISDYIDGF